MKCASANKRVRILCAVTLAVFFACRFVFQGPSPQEIRQKVGVYLWGQMPDLASAVSDAKALGADEVTRTYIGPWWDPPPYGNGSLPTLSGQETRRWDSPAFTNDLLPLDKKMLRPDYQKVFKNFRVIMITAYDLASRDKQYRLPFNGATGGAAGQALGNCSAGTSESASAGHDAESQQFLSGVREEFRRFTLELSRMDRTFIISNWEAENDITNPDCWPWFTRYLQARIDGVVAGRKEARQAGYPARVFTAFEFTVVPGFKGRPSGLVGIGGKLHGLDYLSYSSWFSIGWNYDTRVMKYSFRSAIQGIRRFARGAGLPERVIIGEFGEYWNMHPAAERLKAIVEVSLDEKVSYIFNWVLYEQPGEKDEWGRDASHFGKFFPDRTLTPQGKALREWFSEPTTPTPDNPAKPR